jgi:TonB-linked SusC/RagA family outer membrane protein
MMKNHIKLSINKTRINKMFLCLFVFSVLGILNTHGQIKTVSGIVTDEINTPLPGVSVYETGTVNGVTTDFDGKYSLQVKVGTSITFGYLGYKQLVKIVGKENILNVSLLPDVQSLEEIVIIGYGAVQKKDLTGSVATVKMEKLKEAPVVNFDQALAGRVSGVQVSTNSGEPGAEANIVIRGSNTINGDSRPLYVVDGFIVDNFSPGSVDPSDIESMSVLKDASATAIYGVRGSNGVIIITTKQPKVGVTKVTYETRLDLKTVTKTLDVLEPYDFLKLSDEINASSTASRFYSTRDENGLGTIVGNAEDYRNTVGRSYQDEAFRAAQTRTHKLGISSGTEKTKFNTSLNAVDDEGTLLNSKYSRYSGRMIVNHEISNKLDATVDVNYTSEKQEGLGVNGTGAFSFLRNLITYPGVASQFIVYPEGFDPLSEVAENFDETNASIWHPIVSLNNEVRENQTDRFVANFGLKYKINSDFRAESKVSFNRQTRSSFNFNNSKTVYGRLINKIEGINGTVSERKWKNFNNVNTLTYDKKFGNHRVNALVGLTFNTRRNEYSSFNSKEIPKYLEGLGINSIDGGELKDENDNYGSDESAIFSLLSRVNYNYKGKYLFTASLRRDASSTYSKENRVGYFPSAAVSWNADSEDFIKDLGVFSQLKLKAGYGKTGNDRIPSGARFEFLTDDLANYPFNGTMIPGQRPPSSGANANLFWETTDQVNLGLDAGFFDGRLSMLVEIYQKDTKDLLLEADVAPTVGYRDKWVNTGHVRNRGLEISFNTINVKTKDFKWTSDFNISFNQNSVVDLPNAKPLIGIPNYFFRLNTPQFIVEEGKPLGNIYGRISDGVYQPADFVNYDASATVHTLKPGQPNYTGNRQPGDEKFIDVDGNGDINDADKTIIGNALPVHFGGFNNTFTYKNFQLSAFLQWSYGNDILNANRMVFESMVNGGQNQLVTTLNRWTPENQNTTMHRAGGQAFEDISSRIVEDGSFLRLKTINLSYRLSKDLTEKLKVNSLEFNLSGQNLITWTSYSGYDPEVSVRNSLITPGIDYSSYPPARIISLGLNVSF